MSSDDRVPRGIDVTTPSTARVYDYLLGGKDHFDADQEAAARMLEKVPEVGPAIKANRAFLGRAVRFLVEECGIRQFIDLGTGMPTADNVHQVAQRAASDARVIYVDNDPIVLSHARALLANDANTDVIEGDMRSPSDILANPQLHRLIDLNAPVAVLFVSVLHFVSDAEDPYGVVTAFHRTAAPGSYAVISHASGGERPDDADRAAEEYRTATSTTTVRTYAQIRDLFDGFDLVEPGLVDASSWKPNPDTAHPDPAAAGGWMYAGVGHKRR